MAARERLTLAEGLLTSLQSDPTVGALENARALLASENGDMKLTLRWGGRGRPDKAEAREVRSLLEAEVAKLREALGAPLGGGIPKGPTPPGQPAPKKIKGKARGGTSPAKVTDPNNPDFEKLHPRQAKGRVGGGEFAQKGDGMEGQPDQRVTQLQDRLTALGFKVQRDGQFGGYTEAAVKSFQEKYGLPATGKVDRSTLETLRNPPPKDAATANAEIAAQENPPKKTAGGSGGTGASGGSSASTGGAPGGGGGSSSGTSITGQQGGSLDVNNADAVKAFQRGHGITEDGVVGPETRKAMQDSGTSTTAQAKAQGGRSGSRTSSTLGGESLHKGRGMGASSDKGVRDLQTILQTLGYGLGEAGVDGRFGPDTEKAVKKLQRRYGLKADGIVGKETKALLKRIAKRHAKNVKALDAKGLATEDSSAARKDATTNLPKNEKPTKKIRAAAVPRKIQRPLEEADTTGNPTAVAGTGGYNYAWTQTAGGGMPGFDLDLPSYAIPDGGGEPERQQSWFTIDDGRDNREVADILGRLAAAQDRLAEAVANRMTATGGTDTVVALARERVLRERVETLEHEARAAGIEEGFFTERLHPRDRQGRWRSVFNEASRMHTLDRPHTIHGYRVGRVSESTGHKQYVVVKPDGRATHAASPEEVADIVTGALDRGSPHLPEYPGSTLTHHVPMGVDAPAAHRPEDYFDTSDPRTEHIPVSRLRLSKPPETQPKSVEHAARLMDSAVQGGTSKRGPISVRRNGDGTYTVLDGNATSGVALRRRWPYIPAIVEA